MNCPPQKIVAFLDLLGFSKAVEKDLPGAVRLLQDYAGALEDAVSDESDSADIYGAQADGETARLTRMMTTTSFETLYPASDSIFIVASDVSTFVMQLSHFLMECFGFRIHNFAYPEDMSDPRAVTTTELSSGVETRSETWWPVLFRGGISLGDCLPLNLPMIADAKLGKCSGLIGNAVVQAVGLEKMTKGPRILCSANIQPKVQGDAVAYVGHPLNNEQNCFELYWPMALFEDTASMTDALNNRLRKWLHGVCNLYMHFRHDNDVRVQYEAFIRLLVASALAKYPNGKSELKRLIHSLEPDLIEIAFFP